MSPHTEKMGDLHRDPGDKTRSRYRDPGDILTGNRGMLYREPRDRIPGSGGRLTGIRGTLLIPGFEQIRVYVRHNWITSNTLLDYNNRHRAQG